MRIDNEFSLLDIENEINYSIANEINTHFIVTGDIAAYIVDYLETEHEMPQFSESDDESDKLYDFVDYEVYTISIMADDDYVYFAQESYYDKPHGKIFAELGGEDDIVYVQSETNLSLLDLKRVHSKQTIIFDLVEDECCKCCKDEEFTIDTLLERIKTLEDQVAELTLKPATYTVNGVTVNKDTYEKFQKSFKKQWEDIESRFEKLDKWWAY